MSEEIKDMVFPFSSYQIDELREFFAREFDAEPFAVKVEFVALSNGNLIVGYIEGGVMQRKMFGRYPKYEIPENLKP